MKVTMAMGMIIVITRAIRFPGLAETVLEWKEMSCVPTQIIFKSVLYKKPIGSPHYLLLLQ